VIDVARRFRMASEHNAGNVWNADTLEWLSDGNYSTRSIPLVTSRYPLWQQPDLARDVAAGAYYLPKAATDSRETIMTSAVDASPQYVLRLPMPGWPPVLAAWFTAAFFLLLTFKLVAVATLCAVVAIAALVRWGWELDPPADIADVDIGGGMRLPAYMSGPRSQAWWAIVVLMLVSAMLYACMLVSYLYLWLVSPGSWPQTPPPASWGIAAGVLLVASSTAVGLANRALARGGSLCLLVVAVALLLAALGCNFATHWSVSPRASVYGALLYATLSLDAFFGLVLVALALYALARRAAGLLDARRRVNFDNARLFWHYVVAQNLAGLALIQLFPRAVL
jgi:cytochrome c oxidase subunit I+III